MTSSNSSIESPSKRKIGKIWEHRGQEFLLQNGYTILETNFQLRWGEIDLIAWNESEKYLAFVEMRARSAQAESSMGEALQSLSKAKLKRLHSLAQAYIQKNQQWVDKSMRLELLAITFDKISGKAHFQIVPIWGN